MNHKFQDSVSTQLLKRMEAKLANMRPPYADGDHTNTWEERLENYSSRADRTPGARQPGKIGVKI
jgi:hypothetical protein